MTGGVGQMRVPTAFLESLPVPVAPTAEQERVAEALDELVSDMESGVAALERVREKLKLYRAAVLKSALEGALSKEWRRQHPHREPASALLKRILAERRRRWEEEQLRKFKEKGREPPKNWKTKYKEPGAPDTTGLPPLPKGWCWASIDQLGEVGTGATPNRGQKVRYYTGGKVPWVTSSCVNAPFVRAATEFVTASALEECNLTVYPAGTLLLAMYGEGRRAESAPNSSSIARQTKLSPRFRLIKA
jgi:type I restriction enzyme S subunit